MERERYINAFFANVDWPVVEARLVRAAGVTRRALTG